MKIFILGYPGDVGGACTECWHTIRLWRTAGWNVHLIPTWGTDRRWEQRVEAIGCTTHHVKPDELETVPDLAGSIAVGFCNVHFMRQAARLRRLGCPLVWVNCMTFLFGHERQFYAEGGLPEALVFQSQYQRSQIEPQLQRYGYDGTAGHLIRGAFDLAEWPFRPRPHAPGEPFFFGRVARPDQDKWSSNTWPIYGRIQYRHKRAVMLGMTRQTHAKLGRPPAWAECFEPNAMPVQKFFGKLHCMLAVNGGARENWPRAGLEAMAAGVPIVAQNQWGWPEMVEHGVTGFLGDCDEELAHYAATLAYDERLRIETAEAARARVEELADPETILAGWRQLFASVEVAR